MSLFDLILGPKCADCDARIKGPKTVWYAGRWICSHCKTKRDTAEQKRREEEEQQKKEREEEERKRKDAEAKRKEEEQLRQRQANPLLFAASERNVTGVETLIAAGAPLNATNEDGNTALMLAAINGDVVIVKALIAAGSDVNFRKSGKWYMPAIYFARDADCVKALIDAGADVNVADIDGRTTLESAVSSDKNAEIVKALIAARVDLNAQFKWTGETALMKAAYNCCPENVRLLLSAGAAVNVKDKNGDTVLVRAVQKRKEYGVGEEIIQILTSSGVSLKEIEEFSNRVNQILAKGIPAEKKTLTYSDPCRILYLRDNAKRDSVFKLLMAEFATKCRHIERRNATNRSVMYEHWIVVDDYTTEMQNFLNKADCMPPESQSVDYRTVLTDSESVG